MGRKSDNLLFDLSKKTFILILIYYISILVLGIIMSIYVMVNLENIKLNDLMCYTIIASFSVCGMLCSIQYLKRIYKACLEDRIKIHDRLNIVQVGNILYFFLRPIFAFSFVIVAIFAMLSGFIILTTSHLDFVINDKFLYLCVIVSSCIGFSIGEILDRFEIFSSNRIEDLLKKESKI